MIFHLQDPLDIPSTCPVQPLSSKPGLNTTKSGKEGGSRTLTADTCIKYHVTQAGDILTQGHTAPLIIDSLINTVDTYKMLHQLSAPRGRGYSL